MRQLLLNSVLIGLTLLACKKEIDDTPNNATASETKKWIEETMRKEYFWNSEINKTLNYNQEIEPFFKSMLSEKDGKHDNTNSYFYSFIESKSDSGTKSTISSVSYGMEYIQYKIKDGPFIYQVIAVYPNSPAYGKIKRGDCIMFKNDSNTLINEYAELKSGDAVKLGIVEFVHKPGYDYVMKDDIRWVHLSAATEVEETPFLLDSIYSFGNDKIGYMVFNKFYEPDGGNGYDAQLDKLFEKFKDNNVTKLVIDVRYNPGGYVTTLQRLASLVMPNKNNEILCQLINNRDEKMTYKFVTPAVVGSISDIIILTSRFSASASEALIHCLKPYNSSLYVIGENTEGKNVASQEYKSAKYAWILHPITAKVVNSENVQSSSDGIVPDMKLTDVGEVLIKEFGDIDELQLSAALSHWGLKPIITTAQQTSQVKKLQPVYYRNSKGSGMRITEVSREI